MNRLMLKLDEVGSRPHLLPGDIVKTPKGNIAVIKEAGTIINGSRIGWEDFPCDITFEHGWMPNYAVDFVSYQAMEKVAWWEALEFAEVVQLGPLHKIVEDV